MDQDFNIELIGLLVVLKLSMLILAHDFSIDIHT